MTKFRIGALLGLITGYYLGARAGHERYRQLNRLLDRACKVTAVGTAVGKAKAVVDLGWERARVHETEPLVDLTSGGYANNN
jgi:hypothetical protein